MQVVLRARVRKRGVVVTDEIREPDQTSMFVHIYVYFYEGACLVSVITATEANAPSVTYRVKRVRDHGGISASLVRAGGNWQPASAIRNVRKGSSSPITAVRSVITIAARVKVL